jgi:hypothetical protein
VRENHSKGELDVAMKKHQPEQIVTLPRPVDVEIANGKTTPQACKEAEIGDSWDDDENLRCRGESDAETL